MIRFIMVLISLAMFLVPMIYTSFQGPYVYVSGQKALVRVDPNETATYAAKTTVCFYTRSMEAVLSAQGIKDRSGSGYISGPGYVSLASNTYESIFYDQLKFDNATNYGIKAYPLVEADRDEKDFSGGGFLVKSPNVGSAVLYTADGIDTDAKGYNVNITEVSGDNFSFTTPEGRKLTYSDSGSPIVQNNAFVGAAQVSIGENDTETNCKGLSAPVMYRELLKTENEG
ncbi:hypothetical protein L9W92_01555 [Pelotomaculum terephthalicicum JT]|uniref:hypothetical protein n=1 Tax=Pelotomaculum TaxID=191373 RepID=UPI0009CB5EE3|nr:MULTISPECIES: hypothetical protein [Pelotomaculum]MCG9966743.1 hypothetical protein [Pelotomaculum terephthalicicum JT]OPX85569.1 MAG: hypothetical protein A4E54_02378 [Pelotomaculum sp. PtaB.Bin117]